MSKTLYLFFAYLFIIMNYQDSAVNITALEWAK